MNLVSTIMQFLTPMITNRIASSLGISNAMVSTAIGAILPAILAGLAGKASTPTGASALAAAVDQQDPGLLGSLTNMLGGAGQSAVINNGTSVLSSLLGGSATNALAGAVGKFAGVNPQQSSSLIGMLAPVIMGHLGQAQKAGGLDAGGLAKLLVGQKDNIAAAIPPGFAQLLGGSGLLDSIAGNLKNMAAPAAPRAPEPARPAAPAVPEEPEFNWMPWAIGAAALLALYMFLAKPAPAPVPPAAEKAAAPASTPAVAAASDAMNQAKSVVSGLTSALGNIKDVATAQAAVPQLASTSTALDTLGKLSSSLSPEIRAQIASYIAGAMPQIAPLVAIVLKIPGAEAILKPILDAVMVKLTTLSKV